MDRGKHIAREGRTFPTVIGAAESSGETRTPDDRSSAPCRSRHAWWGSRMTKARRRCLCSVTPITFRLASPPHFPSRDETALTTKVTDASQTPRSVVLFPSLAFSISAGFGLTIHSLLKTAVPWFRFRFSRCPPHSPAPTPLPPLVPGALLPNVALPSALFSVYALKPVPGDMVRCGSARQCSKVLPRVYTTFQSVPGSWDSSLPNLGFLMKELSLDNSTENLF